MVVTSTAFIHSRVGDLSTITAGWRYMQKTMSQEDRNGFEKMINMPGFSVEKFEETYLLKKINPFAQDSNSGESKEKNMQFVGLEEQLTQFIAKWDEFFNLYLSQQQSDGQSVSAQITPNRSPITPGSWRSLLGAKADDYVNLENVDAYELLKKVFEMHQEAKLANNGLKNAILAEIEAKKVEIQPISTTATKTKSDGEESEVKNVTPIAQEDETCSPQAIGSEQPANKEGLNTLSCVTGKVDTTVETTVSPNGGSAISSILSPLCEISPGHANTERPLGTPDSGMISDMSEFKNCAKQEIVAQKEPVDPEKMTGRDGRRYRQKLKKEAEQAAMMNADQSETTVAEKPTRSRSESECCVDKETVPTGKEKRRMKDKLRKEKRLQEQSCPKDGQIETAEPKLSEQVESTEENIEHVASVSTNTTANIQEDSVEENVSHKVENGTESCNQENEEGDASEELLSVSVEDQEEDQSEKMSRGQKKRARKKANKGVYVVNGKQNGSHTVELMANEYKILTIDQQPEEVKEEEKAEEEEAPVREVNVDEAFAESKKEESEVARKPKNFYVAGNLSKNILDTGKWLAYVLDEKDPNGIPKIGEVSNEEVEETIKYLTSQKKVKILEPTTTSKLLENNEDVGVSTPTKSPTSSILTKSKLPKLPELDAEYVRKTFADLEAETQEPSYFSPGATASAEKEEIEEQEHAYDDLNLFMDNLSADLDLVSFSSDFAQRTAPIFICNHEFIEFCNKYSTSKYNPKVISVLVRKYIDARIVFHYERFKKLADRESRRISACWTRIHESSAYSLMVMLFINSPVSNVGFNEIESVLFPRV